MNLMNGVDHHVLPVMAMPVTELACIVNPNDIDLVWPLVADMLDQAYAVVDHVTPDVLAWLKNGDGLLWIAARDGVILGALTSSWVYRRSGKVCRLWACAGQQLDLWLGHLAAIEDYARTQGCVKVCLDGRAGWARRLAGYRLETVALEKAL